MKSLKVLALLALVLVTISCQKDEPENEITPPAAPEDVNATGLFVLNFTSSVNGSPYNLNDNFVSLNNYRIKLEKIDFYVSNIKLLKGNGDVVVRDVGFVSFEQGWTSVTCTADTGTYVGFAFDMGVPADRNINHDPSVYATSHPLSIFQNMHWGWAAGYIFSKFEGRADTTGTGSGLFDQNLVYHSGADTLLRNKCINTAAFTIVENGTITETMDINVAELFVGNNDTVDITVDNSTHTGNDLPLAIRFVDLFRAAMTYN